MSEQHLKGLKIVLTGDFDHCTRKEAVRILENLGADVTGAVSGKTKVIIAGKSPGSKLQKGKAKGLPILDEAQMLLLIGGKTLEDLLGDAKEAKTSQTPMPENLGFPRDGKYEVLFPGTKQVQISGDFVNGLRHGFWKEFWPNGQIKQDYEWKEGLKDGPELDWREDGVQVCDGVNIEGRRKGTWTWWHGNGEYAYAFHHDDEGKTHGEYKWDLEDGSKRARGEYWHGTRHGKWEWWQEKAHGHVERDYYRGQHSGVSKAWFHSGEVSYDKSFSAEFVQHGTQTVFYEDGSPKSKEEFVDGLKVGIQSTWDENGKQVDVTYVEGLPEKALTDKKIASLVKKLTKAKDEYAKSTVLEKAVDWSEKSALVLYLWRHEHYDVSKDTELWETLKESARLISGDEIITFLKNASKPKYGAQLPSWPRDLDELVMRVYLRDPDPIDDAWEKLPKHFKSGIALVRARFGKPIGDVLKKQLKAIAKLHAENYGLTADIWWPDGEGGLEYTKLFDHSRNATDLFSTFLAFFGSHEDWVLALKGMTEKSSEYGRFSFRTFRDVVQDAAIPELIEYCNVISLDASTQLELTQMLLERRNDTGTDLIEVVNGITDTGLRLWPVICAAIIRLSEEGKEIPKELLERFVLSNESPTYTSSWKTENNGQHLNQISDDRKLNFHFVSNFLSFQPGFTSPSRHLIREALSKLTEEQRLSIFERHLASEHVYVQVLVVPYLYLVDAPELWDRAFEIVIADAKPPRETFSWGFGELGARFLPTLVKHVKGEKRKTFKAPWQQGVIFAMLRAAVDGDLFDEEYDAYIEFGAIDPFLIEHLLYRMPADRAEKVLLKTSDPKHASNVFKMAALNPTKAGLSHAFSLLLAGDSSFEWKDQDNIKMGFKSLPNAVDWVRWLLENGAGNRDMYRGAIDWKVFDAIEAEVREGGIEAPKPLDKIDKLVAAAAKTTGAKERIYALRRLDDKDGLSDLNVLGGAAPGVGLDRWPVFEGDAEEPMEHLYTIDLATIPELQARYKGKRTMSVFCYQPENNEAYSVDSGWTEIVFSTQKEVDAKNEVPEDINAELEARFEVVAIDANMQDEEISKQVYGLNARVLGNEIWLQDEEYWGDFVMQFDEGFCYMNLGDSGVMYVYSEGAFWQCY